MNTMKDIVARYLDSWNQIDAGARRANIRGLFAEQCSYTDPNATAFGHEGIDGLTAPCRSGSRGSPSSWEGASMRITTSPASRGTRWPRVARSPSPSASTFS